MKKDSVSPEILTIRDQLENDERVLKLPKSLNLNKQLNFESALVQSQEKSPKKGSKYLLSKRLSLERRN